MPYNGSPSSVGNELLPVQDAVRVFWQAASCAPDPIDVTAGPVRQRTWSCPDGGAVELWTVEGLGHP